MGFRLFVLSKISAILLAVVALAFVSGAGLSSSLAKPEAPLQSLEFVTGTGAHAFRVEVAETSAERAKGLMYRKSMPQDRGMLFDFHTETPVSMWMKNTYIPLDMVFVSRQGVVTKIVADTVPMSEETISGGLAYGVIELNAGVAARIGLKPGDKVNHPAFGR